MNDGCFVACKIAWHTDTIMRQILLLHFPYLPCKITVISFKSFVWIWLSRTLTCISFGFLLVSTYLLSKWLSTIDDSLQLLIKVVWGRFRVGLLQYSCCWSGENQDVCSFFHCHLCHCHSDTISCSPKNSISSIFKCFVEYTGTPSGRNCDSSCHSSASLYCLAMLPSSCQSQVLSERVLP